MQKISWSNTNEEISQVSTKLPNMSDVTFDTLLSNLPYYCIKLYKIRITSVNLLC